MGTEDMRRQKPNVERMGLLGATRRAGRGRRAHAQGGRLGGDPRLGHQRRHHPLHHRLVRRPGAVPGARARPAARDRRRGARADPRAGRAAARAGDRVRRRRLERDRHLHPVRRTMPRSSWSASRPRARGSRPGATARRSPSAARPASCTAPTRRSCRTRTARSSRRTRSRPASTTRAAGPSTPGCATGPRAATSRSPTPRRSTRSHAPRGWRGSSRRSRAPTRWPGRWPAAPSELDLVCLSGRGDKDLAEALEQLGLGPRREPVAESTGIERIAEAFASARANGRSAALMPYLMGGFPGPRDVARGRPGLRRGRRRPDRARRPVLGPARRRSGDPRRRNRGAARRGDRATHVLEVGRALAAARPGRA